MFSAGGFTIVETLIVLAVTGALFAAAAIAIAGRQNRTQFEQAAQDIRSQIQQAINEVATGYYPNMQNFSCIAGANGPSFGAGSTEQGANKGCIFIGKALQFAVSGTDPEQLRVFTIAGLQRASGGAEITSYAEARPKIVSHPSIESASEGKHLLYGLTTASADYGAAKTSIGAIAFVNSLAQYSNGSVVSGAQQVNVIPVRQTSLGTSVGNAAKVIEDNLASSPVNPSGGIRLCFVSGTTNQSGLITIGGNDRQLSVTLDIKGNKICD